MKIDRIIKTAALSTALNALVAAIHLYLGIQGSSWWFVTLGIYYAMLGTSRLTVILMGENVRDRIVSAYTGAALTATSLPLLGMVILCSLKEVGHKYHEILMIAMAAYAFTKITIATIKLIKARRSTSATLITLRNISFADGFVSIFALQRSMLVSFEGMTEAEIVIMNATLGSAVCVIVLMLGVNLLRNKKILFNKLNNM